MHSSNIDMTSYKSPNTPLTTVSLFFVTNHNKAVGTFPHILNHIHKITYIPGDRPAACTALKPWKEIKALLWNLSLLSFFVLSTDKHTQRAYRSRFSEICFTNTHTHTSKHIWHTQRQQLPGILTWPWIICAGFSVFVWKLLRSVLLTQRLWQEHLPHHVQVHLEAHTHTHTHTHTILTKTHTSLQTQPQQWCDCESLLYLEDLKEKVF